MSNYALSNYNSKKTLLKNRLFKYSIVALLCAIFILLEFKNFDKAKAQGLVLTSTTVATIYMDAPFVQASYAADPVYGYGGITETFNFDSSQISPGGYDNAQGTCPTNLAIGTISPVADCLVYVGDPYFGGATTDTISDPYDVGPHSTYAATHRSTPLTITFGEPKPYVGFWWSAGSIGNKVTFLDESGTTVIAQLDANDIYAAASQSTNALSGQPYPYGAYYGHPGELLIPDGQPGQLLNPDDPTSPQYWIPSDPACPRYWCVEPYVYIHAMAAPGKAFGGVQLKASGSFGFEFDNFTTADFAPAPLDRFVYIRQVTSAFTLTTPDNPYGFGYSFGGWFEDSDFTSYIGMPGDVYAPTNSQATQVIYPRWNPSWITIEYIFDDSDFYCYISGYWQDPTYPVPENIFNAQGIADNCESSLSKPGYRLVAWNTAPDGSGTLYNFGAPVDSENLTLYPIWDLASSNLIAPDVVLVDPRVDSVNFPNISIDGSANVLICIQQSNAAGDIDESPAVGFDVLTAGIPNVNGIGSANINGDATTSLLVSGELQDVLSTVNGASGFRAYLSSGNFNSTNYVRIRSLPIASPETEVSAATCSTASNSASKTIEIRPLGLTKTFRKGTIFLR